MIRGVALVEFHHQQGPRIAATAGEVGDVAGFAMADGMHHQMEDWCCFRNGDDEYGVAYFRQEERKQEGRGVVQRSICAVYRSNNSPMETAYRVAAAMATVLADTMFDTVDLEAMMTLLQAGPGQRQAHPIHSLVFADRSSPFDALYPHVLQIAKCLALGMHVLVYSLPVSQLTSMMLAIEDVMPFAQANVYPFVPVTSIEELSQQYKQSGLLMGTTNMLFIVNPPARVDLVLQLNEGTIEFCSDRAARLGQLSPADRRQERALQHQPIEAVREAFRTYFAAAAAAASSSDTNAADFQQAWVDSLPNLSWKQHILTDSAPTHPYHSLDDVTPFSPVLSLASRGFSLGMQTWSTLTSTARDFLSPTDAPSEPPSPSSLGSLQYGVDL